METRAALSKHTDDLIDFTRYLSAFLARRVSVVASTNVYGGMVVEVECQRDSRIPNIFLYLRDLAHKNR